MNLKEEEAVSLIRDIGFTNEDNIRGILKITKKVPLFLKFLKRMNGKNNIDKISKLKIKIHDLIQSKAKNFFVNYYQEFKTEEQKALFKQIIYCLNSPSEFDLSSIKEIMDYQLFELEFVNPVFEKRSSERNEIEQTNFVNKNKVLIDLFNYIENKAEKQMESFNLNIVEINSSDDLKVRIKTKYPMIIRVYKEIFNFYNESLITAGTLNYAIKDYIDYNYQRDKQIDMYETENMSRQRWGFYFEDIVNLCIKENKNLFPNQLSFFQKSMVERYYNAIQPLEKEVIDSEKKKQIEILEINDLSMLYSEYPPNGFDLHFDIMKGLHFLNCTFNHPSIDGGFAYLSFPELIQNDNKLKKGEIEGETFFSHTLDLITYDVTIGDKTKIFNKEKIEKIRNDLKKIYKNITKIKGPLKFSRENFIKHYIIILENAGK